jgi:hypothetical protein
MRTIICWVVEISRALERHDGLLTAIATIVIAAFTFILALATIKLWRETKNAGRVALKTAESLVLSERAYVKMSHLSKGLVSIDLPDEINKTRKGYRIMIQVKNFGRTPATITDVVLTKRVLDIDGILPLKPEYDRPLDAVGVFAFLVCDDDFFWIKDILIKRDDLPDLEHHRKKLIIYGYVDYFDQFKQPHRAGYARQCEPDSPTRGASGWSEIQGFSNLFYVEQQGYNYDHQRKPDEGHQWEEPHQKPPV